MDDALFVGRLEGVRDPRSDFERFVYRYGTACNPRSERFSRDELEHEVVRGLGLLHTVDRSDVRVVERGEDFRLALESSQPLRVLGELIGQDFDRDIPAELCVPGSIDLSG